MPGRYFFRFVAPSRLTFSTWEVHQEREEKGVKNNYPEDGAEMLVFDKRIEVAGFFHHYGLGFDVAADARDRAHGLEKAESYATKFISVLTFLEQYHVAAPQLVLSYRYPTSKGSRTLEQYSVLLIDDAFYQPTNLSLRRVNIRTLDAFLKAIIAATPTVRNAIYFSLHWYWKAVGSGDKRDTFLYLWVALEILEASLKVFFGLPSKKLSHPVCSHCNQTIEECPKCRRDFSYNAITGFTGFKALEGDFADVDGFLRFGKLHGRRSALIHSGGNITVGDIDSCIFSTRVLINAAILTLLNLLGDRKQDAVLMAKKQFRMAMSLPIRMELRGTARVKSVSSVDEPESQPTAAGRYDYHFEIREGDLVPHVTVEHKLADVIEGLQGEKHVMIDSSQIVKDVWEE